MICRVEIEVVIASFYILCWEHGAVMFRLALAEKAAEPGAAGACLLIKARKTVGARSHEAVGGDFSISRSKPGRIGRSGSADFILCAYAIQIEHQLALPGFDLKLRLITQRNGRLFTQSREFTSSDAIHLAKFNKLTVGARGTMLAGMINAEQRSKSFNNIHREERRMKVQDVMTSEVKSCRPEASLAAATMIMLDYDCGALPVVNHENKVIGMITDRDIAIAAATKARLASEIPVSEVISRKVYSAMPDEDIYTALKTMRHEKVRRLPIVNRDGVLQGILSLNDIALRAEEEEGRLHPELTYEGAMSAFKAICEHRPDRRLAA
jgi:CBS domain-containing protein